MPGFVNMIIKFRVPQIAEEFPERIMTTGLTESEYDYWLDRKDPINFSTELLRLISSTGTRRLPVK